MAERRVIGDEQYKLCVCALKFQAHNECQSIQMCSKGPIYRDRCNLVYSRTALHDYRITNVCFHAKLMNPVLPKSLMDPTRYKQRQTSLPDHALTQPKPIKMTSKNERNLNITVSKSLPELYPLKADPLT